ncbi:hypothetical protein [Haloarcula argentinensis]|uniref:Uncharacterized protein n=1 Tax=Haloarcula argentinensis TaxID=43776 RepID=A0ABU2F644_HALAR|nr:hypothetical protein [Haloarcula argentinensis]MDS0256055.1 hypothetical protein [Haloarcula argentinensis]
MIAGTILILDEPADEPLETWFRGGSRMPALEVNDTQETFGDRAIQSGEAAATIVKERDIPTVGSYANRDGKTLMTERQEIKEKMLIDWVADATGTGLILASSVEGIDFGDFPLDLFYNVTGREPKPRYVDVEGLHIAWDEADTLDNTWLNAAEGGDGTRIDYHEDASGEVRANIGLGFTRAWSGSIMRGVVYESGYIALYSCSIAADAVQFIAEEILPHCYLEDVEETRDLEDSVQTCERCGRESDTIEDGHCVVCRDKQEEDTEEAGQNTTLDDLDSVSMAGGDGDAK